MAQVITVSAPTAAAVSDNYKATVRTATYNPMAAAIEDWHAKAIADGDIADRSLLQLVHPPSLALTFLTATHHKVPQTTPQHATAAYLDNGHGK